MKILRHCINSAKEFVTWESSQTELPTDGALEASIAAIRRPSFADVEKIVESVNTPIPSVLNDYLPTANVSAWMPSARPMDIACFLQSYWYITTLLIGVPLVFLFLCRWKFIIGLPQGQSAVFLRKGVISRVTNQRMCWRYPGETLFVDDIENHSKECPEAVIQQKITLSSGILYQFVFVIFFTVTDIHTFYNLGETIQQNKDALIAFYSTKIDALFSNNDEKTLLLMAKNKTMKKQFKELCAKELAYCGQRGTMPCIEILRVKYTMEEICE